MELPSYLFCLTKCQSDLELTSFSVIWMIIGPPRSTTVAPTESTSSSTPTASVEAGDVRSLWRNLKDLKCYNKSKSGSVKKTLICLVLNTVSFNTRLLATDSSSANSTYAKLYYDRRVRTNHPKTKSYPFGWPVNLSHKIVTRFMVPQDWKCACNSSGVAP